MAIKRAETLDGSGVQSRARDGGPTQVRPEKRIRPVRRDAPRTAEEASGCIVAEERERRHQRVRRGLAAATGALGLSLVWRVFRVVPFTPRRFMNICQLISKEWPLLTPVRAYELLREDIFLISQTGGDTQELRCPSPHLHTGRPSQRAWPAMWSLTRGRRAPQGRRRRRRGTPRRREPPRRLPGETAPWLCLCFVLCGLMRRRARATKAGARQFPVSPSRPLLWLRPRCVRRRRRITTSPLRRIAATLLSGDGDDSMIS